MTSTRIRSFAQSWGILLFFATLAGILATLWGYRYATGNQVEQLPVVMRAIDPHYLPNDFFVNASAKFSPRAQFAAFVAFFARFAPLPTVYLLLTIAGNIAIGLATAVTALDLFDGSQAAALFSIAAVMCVKTFWLGYSNVIYRNFLEPEHLATPFLLLAAWAALRRKPVLCALLVSVGAYFHALVGLETGALLLGTLVLMELFHHAQPQRFPFRCGWRSLLTGAAILAVCATLVLLPYLGSPRIPARVFVEILAFFRHPHHYVPSSFETWQWIQAAAFLTACAIAWASVASSASGLKRANMMILVIVIVLALACAGGYLFVEIWPSRLWTTAQVFRMLYLVKWLGLILITGWAASLLPAHRGSPSAYRPMTGLLSLVLAAGLISAPAAAAAAGYAALRSWVDGWDLTPRVPHWAWTLCDAAVLVVIVLCVLRYDPDAGLMLYVAIFTLMILSILFLPAWLSLPTSLAAAGLIVVALLWAGDMISTRWLPGDWLPDSIYRHINAPNIDQPDLGNEELQIARYALERTPDNAIYVVNPSMGFFRIAARHAIVVDFTAFPFQDSDMLEWQRRIYDVYGIPVSTGFDAVPELRRNYTHISDERLLWLAQKYHAQYAVLYRSTKTKLMIIFQTQNYKIVELYNQ
jgi:hypothetical protein